MQENLLVDLPIEILVLITSRLSKSCLLSLTKVSKEMRKMYLKDVFWKITFNNWVQFDDFHNDELLEKSMFYNFGFFKKFYSKATREQRKFYLMIHNQDYAGLRSYIDSKLNKDGQKPLSEFYFPNIHSPLAFAAKLGYTAGVKLFCQHGAKVNEPYQWPHALHIAVNESKLDILNILLNFGADPNIKAPFGLGDSPLIDATNNGNVEIVQCLIQHGANLNIQAFAKKSANNRTPLYFAVKNGHEQLVNILLENGAVINKINNWWQDINLVLMAMYDNNPSIVKTLLDHGAQSNVDSYCGYLIHLAVQHRNEDFVAELVTKYKLDVNTHSRFEHYPLTVAVKNNDISMVKKLLSLGAIVKDCKKSSFCYPLKIARYNQNDEIASLLLSHEEKNYTFNM